MRDPFPVAPMVLRDAPEVVVARATLGATVYFDDVARWAQEGAALSLRALLALAPPGSLRWCDTSAREGWMPFDEETAPRLLASLDPTGRALPRHGLRARVVDDAGAPSTGWVYREHGPRNGAAFGYVQVFLPDDRADDLLQFVLTVGQSLPLLACVGGHTVAWNTAHRATAFMALRPWCRRYLGLDVQDPDVAGRRAHEALPSTSWLTLLGPALGSRLPPDAGLDAPWSEPVTVLPLNHGALVRAGDAPTLGDANALLYPRAYAEVAHRLAPLLPEEPPEFPAWDAESKETAAWMRRFTEPEGWR